MNELLKVCKKACEELARRPLEGSVVRRLKKDRGLKTLADTIKARLHTCGEVFCRQNPALPHSEAPPVLKAVAWNIERGKNFTGVLRTLQTHEELKDADLFFLTEVDWGMARSGNRNVAADLGQALDLHAYFAPSYFNFTNGHGSERHLPGSNELGLHGKAILSRTPLENLRIAALSNATNVLTSKEARLGQKRALVGDLAIGKTLTVACAHLDAFSSPRMRARQMKEAIRILRRGSGDEPALIAGDWNTNTVNSSSGRAVFGSVLRQLLRTGPKRMIREHHPHPERRYDRVLFKTLRGLGFDYERFNEMGVGTYDVVTDDRELGRMAMDQFPVWVLKWINRLVRKSGGLVSLKLDWFAGRGISASDKRVVRLDTRNGYPSGNRPSDHHPIVLTFRLP